MDYDEFMKMLMQNNPDNPLSNKDLEELRKKYSELESKLNEELKSKEQELKEKNKEIKNLNDVVNLYKYTQQNIYEKPARRSYFNFGLSDKWQRLSGWIGEKTEPFYGWFKKNWPICTLVSATLAGSIGSSIYFNFSDYAASVGIGTAVSSLITATAGAILDKVQDMEDYDWAIDGAKFGAFGGALCGPIAYGILNYLEKGGSINWFDNLPDMADVFAKSAIGGIVGPVVAVATFIAYMSIVEKD